MLKWLRRSRLRTAPPLPPTPQPPENTRWRALLALAVGGTFLSVLLLALFGTALPSILHGEKPSPPGSGGGGSDGGGGGGGGGAWPPTLAWPPHRASPFSSHECTAGVQSFDRGYTTQATHAARFPHAEDPFLRICLLRDVCFHDGELRYYVDPALAAAAPSHLQPQALSPHLAYLGYSMSHFGRLTGAGERYEAAFAPTYIEGPRPAHLRYAPGAATIHALHAMSFPNNWGHMLVDTILPALSALEVFGYNHSDLQLLSLVTCASAHGADTPAAFAPTASTLGTMCEDNLQRWLAPAFAHPMLFPADFENACFSRLLVGHAASFSLDALYLHRASAARTLRVLLLRAYGLAHLEAPGAGLSAQAHAIVVLVKAPQVNTAYLPGLCVQVKAWAARLRQEQGGGSAAAPVPVRCAHPALMPAAEQLALYASGTVFVAENGSTTYAALLLAPGASFVAVLGVPEEVAKEAATTLHLPDVNFFYSSLSDMERAGAETLLLAAERAGVRLGLPPALLVAA